MRVIYNLGQAKEIAKRIILTIGIFDGVHRGHQYIIRQTVKKAKSLRATSVLLTFWPHPLKILKPKKYLPLLISLEHRLKLIKELGIDVCIVQKFTKGFLNESPLRFTREIFLSLKPKEIFVGENFSFGKGARGKPVLLEALQDFYKFKLNKIKTKKISGRTVSSTLIRHLIEKGKLVEVTRFLGREVSCCGTVISGDHFGSLLGFPTANINPHNEILPPKGVWAVRVFLEERALFGLCYIGRRPSLVSNQKKKSSLRIEVYIFDFKENIYGKDIEIVFLKKIRPEREFLKKEDLAKQIKKDILKTKRLFSLPLAHPQYNLP
jgi:riboflavin kinase/FMN adenylyltransferase